MAAQARLKMVWCSDKKKREDDWLLQYCTRKHPINILKFYWGRSFIYIPRGDCELKKKFLQVISRLISVKYPVQTTFSRSTCYMIHPHSWQNQFCINTTLTLYIQPIYFPCCYNFFYKETNFLFPSLLIFFVFFLLASVFYKRTEHLAIKCFRTSTNCSSCSFARRQVSWAVFCQFYFSTYFQRDTFDSWEHGYVGAR